MPSTSSELIKFLLKNGFQKVSTKGSHLKMYNPKTNRTTIVPVHNKTLGKGIVVRILKESGLYSKKCNSKKKEGGLLP